MGMIFSVCAGLLAAQTIDATDFQWLAGGGQIPSQPILIYEPMA